MPANRSLCKDCGEAFSIDLERCPHCGRPGLFPNVRRAEAEQPELERRVQDARAQIDAQGCAGAAASFEAEVRKSEAVLTRAFHETQRLASSDHELYTTYYQQISAPARIPAGDRWDALRAAADTALFGAYKEHVRFAALSLDGRGLDTYGEDTWTLREEMIAHRASVFHENSAVFFEKRGLSAVTDPPAGYRATWDDRARLALAKHAPDLKPTSKPADFPRMLLRAGTSPATDIFVEVHIGGPLTVRALRTVRMAAASGRKARSSLLKEIGAKLARYGVTAV